jgi:Beta-lactamase superfamily domain
VNGPATANKRAKPVPAETRFTLLGVGAMNSPRYSPAGLLISRGQVRVAIDGGPGAEPDGPLAAWLVTDERAELIRELRRLAAAHDLSPAVRACNAGGLAITPEPVVHTSHPAYGYLIQTSGTRIVWAPEFLEFPSWAAGADLMFAEAAGWARPIRFAKGAGGHAPALEVAEKALQHGVRRLVFAHIGRATIRALDSGHVPPFGEIGTEGAVYTTGRALPDGESHPCP